MTRPLSILIGSTSLILTVAIYAQETFAEKSRNHLRKTRSTKAPDLQIQQEPVRLSLHVSGGNEQKAKSVISKAFREIGGISLVNSDPHLTAIVSIVEFEISGGTFLAAGLCVINRRKQVYNTVFVASTYTELSGELSHHVDGKFIEDARRFLNDQEASDDSR